MFGASYLEEFFILHSAFCICPIRAIRATIARNHAIPTRFSRCELSKLLHRSKFGKKGICPQIKQMDADTSSRIEQENAESTEFFPLRPPCPPVPSFSSAFICDLRAIPDSVAAGRAGPSVVKSLRKPTERRRERLLKLIISCEVQQL